MAYKKRFNHNFTGVKMPLKQLFIDILLYILMVKFSNNFDIRWNFTIKIDSKRTLSENRLENAKYENFWQEYVGIDTNIVCFC